MALKDFTDVELKEYRRKQEAWLEEINAEVKRRNDAEVAHCRQVAAEFAARNERAGLSPNYGLWELIKREREEARDGAQKK